MMSNFLEGCVGGVGEVSSQNRTISDRGGVKKPLKNIRYNLLTFPKFYSVCKCCTFMGFMFMLRKRSLQKNESFTK